MITTIACPIAMTHDAIDIATAPIWTDAAGNHYRVVSGIIGDYAPTEHTLATPASVTILTGLPGLEALAAMGLTPPAETA